MTSRPPAYLKFIPAILVLVLSGAVYIAFIFISGGVNNLFESGSVGKFIGDKSRAMETIKRAVDEIARLSFPDARKRRSDEANKRKLRKRISREKRQLIKPELKALADKPKVIVNFNDPKLIPTLAVSKSASAKALFKIDEVGDNGARKLLARLVIEDIGGSRKDGAFASGRMEFKEPVLVNDMQALVISVKGIGVKSFGVAILSGSKNGWLRWDAPNKKLNDNEWARFTIPFIDFTLWQYDSTEKVYKPPNRWVNPKTIHSLRFYFREGHLVDGRAGELMVDQVALR